MTPEREREIARIWEAALERPASERDRFLQGACAGDVSLRAQVESLLAQQSAAGSFLETPAMLIAARQAGLLLDGSQTTAAPPRSTPLLNDGPPGSLSRHGPLDDARFAPGQIFASRHRIVSLLGRGAMGEVYRAEDLKLGQAIALKLVAASGARADNRVHRSIAEVRLARTIAHPNVCRVYDIGEADGWWYISMELVDGETLASLLHRIGRLPGEKALDIAKQLCAGLAAAHDRGVVHRDLKPSNIMVDGRGRIRILDFGLAVPRGEWTRGEIAGTPAYMAPEQLVGDRATERSDLYALGLVLYELYAGRKLFSARTPEDRRDHHAVATLAMPGIDPAIERIVHSCLERDPDRRPASALAIAGLLPGGDALSAAIARGVVPSPEMVAAAGPKGALRPVVAWALLGVILLGTLGIATEASVVTVAPADVPKPPEVLAERARNILAGIGQEGQEADSASWFAVAAGVPSSRPPSSAKADALNTVTFVYRQSPRRLIPNNVFRFVTDADPPADLPGMSTVTLDPLGGLISFTRVALLPARRARENAPTVDWASMFAEAGLDEREFVPAEPEHSPRVPHDTRLAWNRRSSASGPLHITASTLAGQPVQFDAAGDIARADTPRDAMSSGSPAGEAALWTGIVLIFAGAAALARYNLRRGEGDRTGARRLGTFVVCVGVLSGILRAHHVPMAVEEATFLFGLTGWSLVWGAFTWLIYISLEPYLRREWPRMLISWTRLLSGRVADPLVGRDVLIGLLAGLVQVALMIARFRVSQRGAPPDTLTLALESLESIPHFTNIALTFRVLNALQFALAGAFLLVVIRLIVRRTWIAAAVMVLFSVPFVPGGGGGFGWDLAFVIASLLVGFTVLLRIGLLAHSVSLFAGVLIHVPVTLDPDAWFFGRSLVVLLILAAVATYGFVISRGGRPAWADGAALLSPR